MYHSLIAIGSIAFCETQGAGDWENPVMPVTLESDPVAWALEKAAARAERVALLDSVGKDGDEATENEDDRTNGWLKISVQYAVYI